MAEPRFPEDELKGQLLQIIMYSCAAKDRDPEYFKVPTDLIERMIKADLAELVQIAQDKVKAWYDATKP